MGFVLSVRLATMNAFTLQKDKGADGRHVIKHDYVAVPQPRPGQNEALVRISAAALNHRDNVSSTLVTRDLLICKLKCNKERLQVMTSNMVESEAACRRAVAWHSPLTLTLSKISNPPPSHFHTLFCGQ